MPRSVRYYLECPQAMIIFEDTRSSASETGIALNVSRTQVSVLCQSCGCRGGVGGGAVVVHEFTGSSVMEE